MYFLKSEKFSIFGFSACYATYTRILSAFLLFVLVSGFQFGTDEYLEEKKIVFPSDFSPKRVSFQEWVNSTSTSNGQFFDHSKLAEGEVLLFRTKKNKHRAIPVMRSSPSGISSRFSDALTFKEWLRKTSPEEKAIRISVKTTDVVRPVLQHLYAAKQDFTGPVIVHANTFASRHSLEKPVDPIIFIETIQKLLPEATISLGWTLSSDYGILNKIDWSRAFKLMSYISSLRQPVMLTMNLNDVLHSADQLEWLLGISDPEVFVLVKADSSTFVDSEEEKFEKLFSISEKEKIIFDFDDFWKKKLKNFPESSKKKKKRSVSLEKWTNLIFPNSRPMLSTSIVSKTGIAFLGWPNALLLSNAEQTSYPSKQVITGKVMFLPKRQIRHIKPQRNSGLIIQFFDKDRMSIDSTQITDSIQIIISYTGQITIENKLKKFDQIYHSSSSGKLPKSPCYEFTILDKGWRIDADISTTNCKDLKIQTKSPNYSQLKSKESYDNPTVHRTFLTLDTPISKTRKLRSIAIGKSGDGVIDFLLQELEHNSSITVSITFTLFLIFFRLFHF